MQRTFIAVKVEPENEMMECILELRNILKAEKIKWVDPQNLHITLRFLGDTNLQQADQTKKLLEEVAGSSEPPEVVFKGLGIFRNIRDPRVLWIGMDPGRILPKLKTGVDRGLAKIGFLPEAREFHPHLTLARLKNIRDTELLRQQLMKYRDTVYQVVQINELIYYESILRPEGPSYLPLTKVSFNNF
jgi:2'-5' RNA ligase